VLASNEVAKPEPAATIPAPTIDKTSSADAGSGPVLAAPPPENGAKYSKTIPPVRVSREAINGAKGGRRRVIDMTGQQRGTWTVLERADSGTAGARWKARHACGGIHVQYGFALRQNPPKSCPTCRGEEQLASSAPEEEVEDELDDDGPEVDTALLERSLELAADDDPEKRSWLDVGTVGDRAEGTDDDELELEAVEG
jgi:hypothetical protein